MPTLHSSVSVVGIDVGGGKKGYHAVALAGGRYEKRFACHDIAEIVRWCVDKLCASVIAVDAPCRWSASGHGRCAERSLMQEHIWCFSTPTRETACQPHRTGYYDWMLRGEALYRALQQTHPICENWPPDRERYCFETFPHAITWHLQGGGANAKEKRAQRGELLRTHGIEMAELTNIDWLDAALCALTAHMAASGRPMKAFGNAQTGFIVVPAKA